MRKEDLSTDFNFDPCWFSLDYTFKADNISNICRISHFPVKRQISADTISGTIGVLYHGGGRRK